MRPQPRFYYTCALGCRLETVRCTYQRTIAGFFCAMMINIRFAVVRLGIWSHSDILAETDSKKMDECVLQMTLEPEAPYLLIPCLSSPAITAPFEIRVLSGVPIELTPLPKVIHGALFFGIPNLAVFPYCNGIVFSGENHISIWKMDQRTEWRMQS